MLGIVSVGKAKAMTETPAEARPLQIAVGGTSPVSGLLQAPPQVQAGLVLAHGAGAGMAHPFLAAAAAGLAQRGIASLRYQFPYMERGSKRPDAPALAQATVCAAVTAAAQQLPGVALFAAGKSFGGRMSSQAQAAAPLEGVRGLVFFGFPLHPPGKPGSERGEHLLRIKVPMLFLQGTRDEFAQPDLLQPLIRRLGSRARLQLLDHADHSFHVPARSGRTDAQVMAEALDAVAAWIREMQP
jgi:predicted alpha/beta-hydrolase family hydrolase